MKIVGPTIVEPWREQIENATPLKRLNELLDRMHDFRVLDPACGSGNFLYIAYRELKRLEARLFERLAEMSKEPIRLQRMFGFVDRRTILRHGHQPLRRRVGQGDDDDRPQAGDRRVAYCEAALPLDNLDANFRAGDALIDPTATPLRGRRPT